MSNRISDAVNKLSVITACSPIDGDALDAFLERLENINVYDEYCEETILSDLILSGRFFKRGEHLTDVVRHFLTHGYDVLANGGINGLLALKSLCWSSYDRHILEAAKMLLNAGVPVKCVSAEDACDEEGEGLLETIGWKVSGAWGADKDFEWANILEAYYALAEAYVAGKDHNAIDSCFSCLGRSLTAVSVKTAEGFPALYTDGALATYIEPLIMWFGDKPLVISCYGDCVVNPVYAADEKEGLVDVTPTFTGLVGATLEKVQYVDSTIGYLEFSNGKRLLFASHESENKNRDGMLEIREQEDARDIREMSIDRLCGISGVSYAPDITAYGEVALALFCGSEACILYSRPGTADTYQFDVCPCSPKLLAEYTRQYPLKNAEKLSCFFQESQLRAIRMEFPDGTLYVKTTDCAEFDVQLSDRLYDPLAAPYLFHEAGKPIRFTPGG